MQLSSFLRTVLKFDAASCIAMGVLAIPASGALQVPLGIDSLLLAGAAAPLIPIGLFMLWLGTRSEAPAAFVWLVILGNLGWATGSLTAAAALPGVTLLGQVFVAGQGLAVLALAIAEWVGLRGSREEGWSRA